MSEPLMEIRDLVLSKQGKVLLNHVCFQAVPGRFYGLLGPNGAGKSSLLRILYRADKQTTGSVSLSGREIVQIPRREYAGRVGALVQEQVSLSGLTLEEVVRLGLLPLRLPDGTARERVLGALELTGLASRAGDDAAKLSGGEQQRLFFAQLLALDPEIYLLDEPHNHLDLHFQYRLLEQVRQRGRTVIASFHDIGLAARYCDEVLLLDRGSLVAQGAIDEVLSEARLADVYRVRGRFRDGRVDVAGALD